MIRISCEGLAGFIQGFLSAKFRLHSLAVAEAPEPSLREGEDRWLALTLSSRDPSREPWLEKRLSSLVRPLGLLSSVVWVSRGSRSAEWAEMRRAALANPWGWMALVSSVALVTIAGWAAFFWISFWGTAAWFIVKGLLMVSHSSFFRAAGGR